MKSPLLISGSVIFILFSVCCSSWNALAQEKSDQPPVIWRSTEPVQVATPTITSEEISLEDSATFMITPLEKGILVNFHYNRKTDTLLADTAQLHAFIRTSNIEAIKPFVILKMSRDIPYEDSKAIIEVLREHDLRTINFVTELE